MTEQEVLVLLRDCGAILTNIHVCLTPKQDAVKWYHSDGYVAKDNAIKRVRKAQPFYQAMAESWVGRGIEAVVGPAVGAIAIAHGVALALANFAECEILAVYAEPKDPTDKGSPFVLKRGFDGDVEGRRVLVVEDILTTGGSAKRTVEAVRNAQGVVVGLAVIANRGNVTKEQDGDVPKLTTLVNITMKQWPALVCPLCVNLTPLRVDIGKGDDWLKTEEGLGWLRERGTTTVGV